MDSDSEMIPLHTVDDIRIQQRDKLIRRIVVSLLHQFHTQLRTSGPMRASISQEDPDFSDIELISSVRPVQRLLQQDMPEIRFAVFIERPGFIRRLLRCGSTGDRLVATALF